MSGRREKGLDFTKIKRHQPHAATLVQRKVAQPHAAKIALHACAASTTEARPPHAAARSALALVSKDPRGASSSGSKTAALAVAGSATAQPVFANALWNTAGALGTGLYNTLGAAGTGLYDTAVAATGGIQDTYNAWGTGKINTGAAAVRGLWRTGTALVGGTLNTGVEVIKGVAHTGAALGTGLANTGAQYVPAAPEWVKEYVDPRRATRNPYWRRSNQAAIAYEGIHGPGVGYHTVERHGGQHTLTNIRARLIPFPGPGNLSYMQSPAGGQVKKATTSSRFATDAWHNYTREMAKARFAAVVPHGLPAPGAAWTWPAVLPVGWWNAAHTFVNFPNQLGFYITYTNNIVGFSVDGTNQYGVPCNSTYSLVGYDNAGNAYLNQHYPVVATAVAPAQQRIGLGAPLAPLPGANQVVAYDAVPWF
jgi:hypothetical protein